MKKTAYIILLSFFCFSALSQGIPTDTTNYLISGNWDTYSSWQFSKQDGATTGSIANYNGLNNDGIAFSYSFPSGGGWVNMELNLSSYSIDHPIVLFIHSSSGINDLELKFIDNDGSVFGVKTALSGYTDGWEHITVYLDNTDYWWGGDSDFDTPAKFSVALSGSVAGSATVYFDEIGIGKSGLPSSFLTTIDPNYALPGIGFLQRRDASIDPEDTLVLKYLKVMQDKSSAAGCMLPTYKGGTEAQTFNNSLVAIAYIAKNERERAERILDYYLNATDSSNTDLQKQNFFYNGEARGFYQQFLIATDRDGGNSDRWIGDMAWLLIACKNYAYNHSSDRYDYLIRLIKDLFISFYKDVSVGGFVQSGWRDGDSYLHEPTGHHEGNIDCYVALKLCGEDYYAYKIKLWLDKELAGKTTLPLDLYTWRAMAFGAIDESYVTLLNIPEYDFRYRKIINVDDVDVMGMFSVPDISIDNFWNDGTGHISCAFQAFGDIQRGYFYANQLDHLIIEQVYGTEITHGIPYTLNTDGFPGVDPDVGVISCAVWYILAKNGCNPFLSDNFLNNVSDRILTNDTEVFQFKVHPNPFISSITINYNLSLPSFVSMDIYDIRGQRIRVLVNSYQSEGSYFVPWYGDGFDGRSVMPGIYLIRLSINNESKIQRVVSLVR